MTTLIDLSHPIANGTVTYPGLPGPVITDFLSREQSRDHYEKGTEFQIGRIEMVSNTGTYLDTPFHRFPDGYDLAGLALEWSANLEAVCIRIEGGREITPEKLGDVEVTGRAALFHTGWATHWGSDRYGEPDHPYLTEAAAELLVDQGVHLVGIDSVNIDDTRSGSRPAHTLLLSAGIPIVEHLTGLEALPETGFRFFAAPPRVGGMGTFPVRAFAVVGAQSPEGANNR